MFKKELVDAEIQKAWSVGVEVELFLEKMGVKNPNDRYLIYSLLVGAYNKEYLQGIGEKIQGSIKMLFDAGHIVIGPEGSLKREEH